MPTPRGPEHMRKMVEASRDARAARPNLKMLRRQARDEARACLLEDAQAYFREKLLTPALESLAEDVHSDNWRARARARDQILAYGLGRPVQQIAVEKQEDVTFSWNDPAVEGAARLKAILNTNGE